MIPGLKPFQQDHAKKMMDVIYRDHRALDRSTTGTGKTYVTAAICRELQLHPVILCPRAGIHNWRYVLGRFGVQARLIGNYEAFKFNNTEWGHVERRYYPFLLARYLNLKCNYGPGSYVLNWKDCLASLRVTPQQLALWEVHHAPTSLKSKCTRAVNFTWSPYLTREDTLFVYDEAHYCRTTHSINSLMLTSMAEFAKDKGPYCLLLTATPAHDPRNLRAMGLVFGWFDKYGYYEWLENHGVVKMDDGRMRMVNVADSMKKIHNLLEQHGGMMNSADIPGFPPTVIEANAYTIENPEAYNRKFFEMLEKMGELREQGRQADALTLKLRLRMWAEQSKVQLFVDLAHMYCEKGASVVIFVNFDYTRTKLSQILGTRCMVYGEQKEADRVKSVADFQADRERIIICNMQAGGTSLSLHDITGRHFRVALISPTYDAFILKQVLGRVPRDGGTKSFQHIVYLAGTEEQKVCDKVNAKLQNMAAITEGDLTEETILKVLGKKENL